MNFPTQIVNYINSYTQNVKLNQRIVSPLHETKQNTSSRQPSLPVPQAVLDRCPSSIRTCRVAASFPFLWPTKYCRFVWRRKVGVPWLEVYRFTSSSLKRVSLCQTFVPKTPVKKCRVVIHFFWWACIRCELDLFQHIPSSIKPSQPLQSSSNLISWAHVVQLSDNRTTVKIRGL